MPVAAQAEPAESSTPTRLAVPPDLFRSQFGEDRILWRLFGGRRDGFFIEVGAFDGVSLSTTWFFEQMGWRGILIEPVAELCAKCVAARPRSRVVHAAAGRRNAGRTIKLTHAVGKAFLSFTSTDAEHVERCRREGATLVESEVALVTLTDVLNETRRGDFPCGSPWRDGRWAIDLVSIDTEGAELDVLDGFDLDRFRPMVVMVENDRPSGAAIEPYLAERGYARIHRQVINDIYVRREFLPPGFEKPTEVTWGDWTAGQRGNASSSLAAAT